ncbi:hypothetical protein H4R18_005385 [Coemansia javaensis]|uniref:Protein PNS1 n=1 Tax=Coemansia javaensis TaxID=2761396 RepID=A0A9W8LDF1_9FUNG|nr:hypothetical protein H4R18_005385 [Coemansia javaensis]
MSFRDRDFREACLAWISALSGEHIAEAGDLADGRVLIDIATEADPEYFAAASLVLPSRAGEPNLDALAQLARLLLRYFEQGLGRQLDRDYVPGVASLTGAPYDDLWRLLALVVSMTLLSERNGASRLYYDGLGRHTQDQLRTGIGGMWGDGPHVTPPLDVGPRQPRTPAHRASSDSIASVQTSLLQFESAYSSLPGRSLESVAQPGATLGPAEQPPSSEPALLPVSESTQSTSTIAGPLAGGLQRARALMGLVESSSSSSGSGSEGEDEQEDDEAEADGGAPSDTESYVSEFSQDLDQYGGVDTVSMGFSGPNALAAYAFVANSVAYVATGLYLLATTSVPQRGTPVFRDYYDVSTAVLEVLLTSAASAAVSVGWVLVLRQRTREVVWTTTLSVPVVGAAAAAWAGARLFALPGVEGLVGFRIRTGLVAAAALVLAARFAWTVARRRRDIEGSVDVIRLACDVLVRNRALHAFSLLLLALYGAFAVGSGIVATRLPLLAADSNVTWALAAYLAASFAWTSAVAVQLLRAVVASVVCQWYFHRHDPDEPPALHTLQASAVAALTTQLGTVAASAAVLLAAAALHVAELLLRWGVALLRAVPPLSLVSLLAARPVRLADRWTSYTLVYAAFTGRGFCDSSRAVTRLLRKHQLLHSPVVSLIKSSMTCYALLLSLLLGYALGLHAIAELSARSALAALAGSAMPFALLQLTTHVLSCTVEALVVCYAIDMELGSCHSVSVAEALAAI